MQQNNVTVPDDTESALCILAALLPIVGIAIAVVRLGTQRPGGRILAASLIGFAAWFCLLFVAPAVWESAVQSGMRR